MRCFGIILPVSCFSTTSSRIDISCFHLTFVLDITRFCKLKDILRYSCHYYYFHLFWTYLQPLQISIESFGSLLFTVGSLNFLWDPSHHENLSGFCGQALMSFHPSSWKTSLIHSLKEHSHNGRIEHCNVIKTYSISLP